MGERTVTAILRDIDQIQKANIPAEMKAKFILQKQAELTQIASVLPDAKPATLEGAGKTPGKAG